MTCTQPTPTEARARSTAESTAESTDGSTGGAPAAVEPVADVSGIAWSERVVVDLGPDWPALRALARFATALIAGAAVGELLAGAAGGLAGAMTAFTAYVASATTATTYRNRHRIGPAERSPR